MEVDKFYHHLYKHLFLAKFSSQLKYRIGCIELDYVRDKMQN